MPRPEPVLRLLQVTFLAAAGALALPVRAEPVLRPAALPEDDYVEGFSFVADLDGGIYVQLQLGVTNLGPDAGTGYCRALVHLPEAGPWTASRRFGHRWGHAQTGPAAERLDVGSCWTGTGPSGATVHVELDGRTVELTFPRPTAPIGPPAADLRVGDRSYQSWVVQAFTPVSAALTGFGRVDRVAGGGFADKSRSNVRYRDLARSWVRFRALRGDRRVVVLARQAADGQWTPAWARWDGKPPEPLKGVEVVRSGSAFAVTLAGHAGGRIAGRVPLYRFTSLSELGVLARVVSPFVGNAVTYTQRATLSPPGEGPIDGILEVSVFED